jgi:hypothetical protein
VSDPIFTGERHRPPAVLGCAGDGGDALQCRLLMEDACLALSGRVSSCVGERPNPPSTFQVCQSLPVSGFVFSSLSMCSLGLAEAPTKGLDLQFVLGELSLAVNSESLDDALCSDLLRSHEGEDEVRLTIQPLNILYPCADNEFEFPDWVIKCAELIHSRVGIMYIGQK